MSPKLTLCQYLAIALLSAGCAAPLGSGAYKTTGEPLRAPMYLWDEKPEKISVLPGDYPLAPGQEPVVVTMTNASVNMSAEELEAVGLTEEKALQMMRQKAASSLLAFEQIGSVETVTGPKTEDILDIEVVLQDVQFVGAEFKNKADAGRFGKFLSVFQKGETSAVHCTCTINVRRGTKQIVSSEAIGRCVLTQGVTKADLLTEELQVGSQSSTSFVPANPGDIPRAMSNGLAGAAATIVQQLGT